MVLWKWQYWHAKLKEGADAPRQVLFLDWEGQSAGQSHLTSRGGPLYPGLFMQRSPIWIPPNLLLIILVNLKCMKWEYTHLFSSSLGEQSHGINSNYKTSHSSISWPTYDQMIQVQEIIFSIETTASTLQRTTIHLLAGNKIKISYQHV